MLPPASITTPAAVYVLIWYRSKTSFLKWQLRRLKCSAQLMEKLKEELSAEDNNHEFGGGGAAV